MHLRQNLPSLVGPLLRTQTQELERAFLGLGERRQAEMEGRLQRHIEGHVAKEVSKANGDLEVSLGASLDTKQCKRLS